MYIFKYAHYWKYEQADDVDRLKVLSSLYNLFNLDLSCISNCSFCPSKFEWDLCRNLVKICHPHHASCGSHRNGASNCLQKVNWITELCIRLAPSSLLWQFLWKDIWQLCILSQSSGTSHNFEKLIIYRVSQNKIGFRKTPWNCYSWLQNVHLIC